MKRKKEKTEQPKLSNEQLELFNAHMERNGEDRSSLEPYDQSTKAKVLRYAKKNKAVAISSIVVALSIVAVLILFVVYFYFFASSRPNKSNFTVIVGENKYSASYEDIIINDIAYIDMTKISLIDGIQLSGDYNSLKYTLPNLQYIRFDNESDIAIVDGTYAQMGAPAIIEGTKCFVPFDFLKNVFKSGLVFSYDDKENIITISRVEIGKDNNNNIAYEPLSISFSSVQVTEAHYDNFGIDILEYIEYINPADSSDYLILINHQNPLSADYVPKDLILVTSDTNPANSDPTYYKLRKTAERSLHAMMISMKNAGIKGIQVSSTYRSYERQEYLWDYYINSKMSANGLSYENAKKEVKKTLALPGHSEHQSGLSVDFVQGTKSLTTDFENTTAFAWLSKNAHKFGFILRYPSNKVSITGYDYEPWHYRYVGRTVASRIYEAGICYEEYVELNH